MQGWPHVISTAQKIRYINALLEAGFDTIDFGSFVSPKAIPQMADTAGVLAELQWRNKKTDLLAIVANRRGAETAAAAEGVRYIGFPFSVSETFQQRNTNSSILQSLETVAEIQQLCARHQKEMVVYLSMGFGNPYGDPWSPEIVFEWAERLVQLGVGILSLADTVGLAKPAQVGAMTKHLIEALPGTRIGVHLHASRYNWEEKLEAAFDAGCRRFDGALRGIGGCPMAGDELVGNLDTLQIIRFLEKHGLATGIDREALEKALLLADEIFSS